MGGIVFLAGFALSIVSIMLSAKQSMLRRIVWWSLPIVYAVAAVGLSNVGSGHPFDWAAALAFAGALLLLGWATVKYQLARKPEEPEALRRTGQASASNGSPLLGVEAGPDDVGSARVEVREHEL